MTEQDFHRACAVAADALNFYLPAIEGKRSPVYCLGAQAAPASTWGSKWAAHVWVKVNYENGDEFAIMPLFPQDTGDPVEKVAAQIIGYFLYEWAAMQNSQNRLEF